MNCPYCQGEVSAFSSKCQHCTADYGVLGLWISNFISTVIAVIVVIALLMIIAAAG